MAKLNEKYEAVVVFSTKNGEDAIKELNDKVTNLITKYATLDSTDEWGKRKLAYEINDETDGYYVLYKFTSEPTFPVEFERVLKITDGVLREVVTVRIGE